MFEIIALIAIVVTLVAVLFTLTPALERRMEKKINNTDDIMAIVDALK